MVVAKNDFAHEALAAQFKEKSTLRIYHAVCLGVPTQASGTIQSYLSRHLVDRKRNASVLGSDRKIIRKKSLNESQSPGKWAVTHFKTLQKLAVGVSYLELRLETGRTHQIRVHLSELRLPIVSDKIYGSEKKLKNIKSSAINGLLQKMPRLALHAMELGFVHPRTNEKMMFKVDWPELEKSIINKLGLSE